jgi:hypothetical protein
MPKPAKTEDLFGRKGVYSVARLPAKHGRRQAARPSQISHERLPEAPIGRGRRSLPGAIHPPPETRRERRRREAF